MPESPVVALTGGGGFIGSRTVAALAERGHRVRTLLGPAGDDLVEPPAGVESRRGDLSDPDALRWLVEGAATVVHAAGPSSVAASFADPLGYARVHVEGTAAVVASAVTAGVARIVHVSSAEIYGRAGHARVSEDAPPAPRSPYAAAKVGAEAFVTSAVRTGSCRAIVVRPFLVYGPGMAPWSMVGGLVRTAARGGRLEPIDRRPVRDLCHVDDVAAALVACVATDPTDDLVALNICSGRGRSVGEIAGTIAQLAGVDVAVDASTVRDRPPSADLPHLVGDPTRALEVLGWRATTSERDGLSDLLAVARSDAEVLR